MSESIIVKRGNPILSNDRLDKLAELIGDLYPGLWGVYDHGPAYPHDYSVGTGEQKDTGDIRLPERTVLPGPIGHENLARYLAAVQPSAVRRLLADNQRLRQEVANLREGRGHFPAE